MSSFHRHITPKPGHSPRTVELRNGGFASRAQAAFVHVTLSNLLGENPELLGAFIRLCLGEDAQIGGLGIQRLRRDDLLIEGKERRLIIPEVVRDITLSMLPPPGSGAKLLVPFDD